ncbi:disulfide bond formation protein B [Ferrimonas kyonanensis]|uniref:disulfide bond formation protein B n=2 Tax=Ferrimonas TaxID=44011 RepID=UPI001FE23369|nr:disulfide bond formation protein B [Ferrimonas kyonanensis]
MMNSRGDIFNKLASLASIVIMALPVGIACFVFGFIMKDNPCAFCWEERTAMVLVALTAIYIVRYGLKPKYIAALVFLGIYGAYMASVHTGFNFASDIGQGFSVKIMGAHTYSWALFVFLVVLVVVAALLMFLGNKFPEHSPRSSKNDGLVKAASYVFLFVIAGNIVQAFTQTGPAPFVGQDSPGRVSFNPKYMSWELDHWPSYSPDARGPYAVSDPDYDAITATAPIYKGAAQQPMSTLSLPAEIATRVTGIDYQPEAKLYAVTTTDMWVYILDATMTKVITKADIDGMYMLHISPLVGVGFVSPTELVVMGDNKAFAKLVLSNDQTWEVNYRRFNESSDGIGETERGQFATVRAKHSYSVAFGFDSDKQQFVSVTAKNEQTENLVASRFALEDMTLSAEQPLSVAAKQGQWLQNLPLVTGISVDNGASYLLSNSGSEVLVMDNESGEIEKGIKLAAPVNPYGLVKTGNSLLVTGFENGINKVYQYAL